MRVGELAQALAQFAEAADLERGDARGVRKALLGDESA